MEALSKRGYTVEERRYFNIKYAIKTFRNRVKVK